jgi:hypothetical protein
MHFVKTDIRLLINDALTLQKRNGNPYQYKDRFAVIYDNKTKNEKTSIPAYPTIDKVNAYTNWNLFGKDQDTISSKMNVASYVHMFCSDVDDILKYKLYNEKTKTIHRDKWGNIHPYYSWQLFNEASIMDLPFFLNLKDHIKYCPFFRSIQTLAIVKLNDVDDEPIDERYILDQTRELSNWEKLKALLTRNHDISKARYLVYYRTVGIDSTEIKIIFSENVEFSSFSGGGNPSVERDRVIMKFAGDQKTETIFTNQFHVRFLESQNAQDLRVLFLSTLLAFLLACWLKLSVDYLLTWYSKALKLIRNRSHE